MKRNHIGAIQKIWPFSQSMKVKPGMSEKTMLIPAGARRRNSEQWRKRTVTRRVGNR
jgi:hypothetical protein